jgi:hypothetical protein
MTGAPARPRPGCCAMPGSPSKIQLVRRRETLWVGGALHDRLPRRAVPTSDASFGKKGQTRAVFAVGHSILSSSGTCSSTAVTTTTSAQSAHRPQGPQALARPCRVGSRPLWACGG